jgi:RNA polymerase sigma-70 factor (ECF subfamily)
VPLDAARIERLLRRANGERWGLSAPALAAAVEAGAARAFAGREPSARELDGYLDSLHLPDLALACACAGGHDAAWEHLVRELRPVLYRAADAIDPTGGARELADSLYADLYGLDDRRGERRSLFRYFHGRSSLATWLRAVLAQRHVDQVRAGKRTEPLPAEERNEPAAAPAADPDTPRLAGLVQHAFRRAIDRLPVKDRFRLRSYYVAGLTLAQIGRLGGDHEATVSRHLTRIRREVRDGALRHLREEMRLQPAEVDQAIRSTLDDPGELDLAKLLGAADDKKPAG